MTEEKASQSFSINGGRFSNVQIGGVAGEDMNLTQNQPVDTDKTSEALTQAEVFELIAQLEGTENNISQPLPIVLNLSSWATKRKSISEWLIQEVNKIYGVSKSLVKAWVKEEQLILLLDGLDEVENQYRNDCVKALNQFIQAHGLIEIVVCCRIEDYNNLSDRLKLCSAICVKPLTFPQIEQFLDVAGEPLLALKSTLENNVELQQFASSPLILSIMALAYVGYDTEILTEAKSIEEQQKKLFNAYIRRMLSRRGTTKKYSEKKTIGWLFWIANNMVKNSQSIFLIEQLQPDCLSPIQRTFYRIKTGLSYGFFIFFFSSISLGDSRFALLIGLTTGILIGLFDNIRTVESLKWSWSEAKFFASSLFVIHTRIIPLVSLIMGQILGVLLLLFDGLVVLEDEQSVSTGFVDGAIHGFFCGAFIFLNVWLCGLCIWLIRKSILYINNKSRKLTANKKVVTNNNLWKLVNLCSIVGGMSRSYLCFYNWI